MAFFQFSGLSGVRLMERWKADSGDVFHKRDALLGEFCDQPSKRIIVEA